MHNRNCVFTAQSIQNMSIDINWLTCKTKNQKILQPFCPGRKHNSPVRRILILLCRELPLGWHSHFFMIFFSFLFCAGFVRIQLLLNSFAKESEYSVCLNLCSNVLPAYARYSVHFVPLETQREFFVNLFGRIILY